MGMLLADPNGLHFDPAAKAALARAKELSHELAAAFLQGESSTICAMGVAVLRGDARC